MTTTYTHILDLAKDTEQPPDGTPSRTDSQDEHTQAVALRLGHGRGVPRPPARSGRPAPRPAP